MMPKGPHLNAQAKHQPRYCQADAPTIAGQMAAEGLSWYRWSNGPGDIYPSHHHGYHKVIVVVQGSITFGLPDKKEAILLKAGDRLDLPAGMTHDAVVGPQGVVCLEGHRSVSA